MPKQRSGMVKSNLFIDPKVQRGIKYLAARRGTTYSALVREAMREFVMKGLQEEKKLAVVEHSNEAIISDATSNS